MKQLIRMLGALLVASAMIFCVLNSMTHTAQAEVELIDIANSIWVPLGPENSGTNIIVGSPITPSVLYVGSSEKGVLRSSDNASSWLQVNEGLTDTAIATLAVHPISHTVLLAGTNNGNLFKSTDSGEHWHFLPGCSQYLDGNPLKRIVFDSDNPNTVYVMRYIGIHKSLDGGDNCSYYMPDHPNVFQYAFTTDPITSSTLYLGTNRGILKSLDGGLNWAFSSEGLDDVVFALSFTSSEPHILYAGTLYGIYKSIDHAAQWEKLDTGLVHQDTRALVIDPTNPAVIYIGMFKPSNEPEPQYNLAQTIDGGENWHSISTGWGNPSVNSIFIDSVNRNTIFVSSWEAGVFKSVEIVSRMYLPIVFR